MAYKGLFDQQIPNYTLEEIRNALNKAWVLGEDRFKEQIEEQTIPNDTCKRYRASLYTYAQVDIVHYESFVSIVYAGA